MMAFSQAAVFDGTPGSIRHVGFETPTPRAGEILVRVLGSTLCGSDLHTYWGRRSAPVPTVLGHEIVGEIVALGPDAPSHDARGQSLAVGDRLTWSVVANCGKCFYCSRDLPAKCCQSLKYGHESIDARPPLVGGFAEHCLLVAGTSVVRLADDLPIEVACPANCATATVCHALEAAGPIAGRRVLITGAGLLGLTASALANVLGAESVIVSDPDATRSKRSLGFGATDQAAPATVESMVKERTDGFGVDLLLEFSGQPAAFEQAFPLVRMGGRIVLAGSVFPAPAVAIELEQIVRRNLTMAGIHNYAPRHLVEAVKFLEQHHRQFDFAGLVHGWLPLAQIDQAMTLGRDPSIIRVGVRP